MSKSQLLRAVKMKEIMRMKRRFLSTARKMSNMLTRKDKLNLKNNVASIEQQILDFSKYDKLFFKLNISNNLMVNI